MAKIWDYVWNNGNPDPQVAEYRGTEALGWALREGGEYFAWPAEDAAVSLQPGPTGVKDAMVPPCFCFAMVDLALVTLEH